MNEPSEGPYKLDQADDAKKQVRAIAAYAKAVGSSRELGRILRKALHHLQADPHGWGDPLYGAKTIDAVMCRALIRPVAFRDVIYEHIRTVMLLSVRLYADFD
jgi:hypothetical protein